MTANDKQNEIRRLITAGFKESPEWIDWYFSKVYSDKNAMLAYAASQPVSCLMLDQYKLKLGDAVTDMSYISCATTARNARHQGHMSRLLSDALMESASRGDSIAALIPASRRLYFYYDKFAFATVFYADEQRYTSLHQFHFDNRFIEVGPDWQSFHRLEEQRRSAVIHSQHDFENILTDNILDNGYVISLADKESIECKAMLFATVGEEAAVVHDIFATSPESEESILALLRKRVGEKMIIINAPPSDSPFMLKSRGMARIVNVERLLEAIAQQSPQTDQVIRVSDNLLTENDAVYIIHDGHVEKQRSTLRRISLDVSIDNLARIIFNSKRIADVFGIPTFRPSMALMLD